MTKQPLKKVLLVLVWLIWKQENDVQLPYFDQQKHHFHTVQPNTSVIKHTERVGASLVTVQQNSICGESSHK